MKISYAIPVCNEHEELKRLLDEAKERLNKQYKTIRERTWSEWIFEWFGIY